MRFKTKRNYHPLHWRCQEKTKTQKNNEIWKKKTFLSIYVQPPLRQVTGGWIQFQHQFGKSVVRVIRMPGRVTPQSCVYCLYGWLFHYAISIFMQVQLYFRVDDLSSCANLWAVLHLCDVVVLLFSFGTLWDHFCLHRHLLLIRGWLAVFTLRYVYLLDIDLG